MFVKVIFLLMSLTICWCKHCNDGSNPCHLDKQESPNSYFLPINGFYCLDGFNGEIICTCPDNSTKRDQPCRICDRNPSPCGSGPTVVTCTDINRSFSCLCKDEDGELIASSHPCDGTIDPIPSGDGCENDGVKDPDTNLCHCPSGFTGIKCESRTATNHLCDKIECMSNGVCAVRPILPQLTVHEAKCLCRAGYDGDYCERQGVLGTCTTSRCLNGGSCQQWDIGTSRYIFCLCHPGWAGSRCDRQYFQCRSAGSFIDQYMKKQGKYFSCVSHNNKYLLKQNSCPKGLKYNTDKRLCLL